jgi:hypothetical protein
MTVQRNIGCSLWFFFPHSCEVKKVVEKQIFLKTPNLVKLALENLKLPKISKKIAKVPSPN